MDVETKAKQVCSILTVKLALALLRLLHICASRGHNERMEVTTCHFEDLPIVESI